MFNTSGIEEKVFESKYITPGISDVTISGIEGSNGDGKSPYVMFNFTKMNTTQTASIKFFLSEAASKRSLEKIKHIATKVVTEEAINAVSGNDAATYAQNLSKLLVGKSLRIKFSGEEVQGKDGKNNWYKATIGLPSFAEKLGTTPSKLKFDANNNYDMKKLPVATDMSSIGGVNGSGLPF